MKSEIRARVVEFTNILLSNQKFGITFHDPEYGWGSRFVLVLLLWSFCVADMSLVTLSPDLYFIHRCYRMLLHTYLEELH